MSDSSMKNEISISEDDFKNIEMTISTGDETVIAVEPVVMKSVVMKSEEIEPVVLDSIIVKTKEVEEKMEIPIEDSYNIPNPQKLSYLKSKLVRIRDKQLIYEYHYEGINYAYNTLSLCIVILSTVLTTIEAGQFADFSAIKPLEYTLKGIAVALGLTITLVSSVIKFRQYKEKVESIGKYMDQLDILADDIEFTIKKIELSNISDQDFYSMLQTISIIVTRTNSKLFNITSKQFYNYYKKLKLLDYNKWEIYYATKTRQESSYNVFLEKRLESQNKRFVLETELREIGKKIKEDPQLTNRFKRDIFKYPDTVKET